MGICVWCVCARVCTTFLTVIIRKTVIDVTSRYLRTDFSFNLATELQFLITLLPRMTKMDCTCKRCRRGRQIEERCARASATTVQQQLNLTTELSCSGSSDCVRSFYITGLHVGTEAAAAAATATAAIRSYKVKVKL